MQRLVHEMLLDSSRRSAAQPAVICDGRVWTYAELTSRMLRLASVLRDAGVSKGARVLVALNEKQDFLASIFATMAAGGIAVPCPEHSVPDSLRYYLDDSTPRVIMTSRSHTARYPMLNGLRKAEIMFVEDVPFDPHSMGKERSELRVGDFRERVGGTDIEEHDGAMILYTSGTTGKRKGVLLTHMNLVQATQNINAFMGIDARTCEFIGVPLTHSFGFGRSRCVLAVGGTIVVSNGMLNPAAAVNFIRNHQCNALSMVPAGFAMFFGRFEHLLGEISPQIRWIEIGSSPMHLHHKLKLLKFFPQARICMHYGLTEASRSTLIEFHGELSHIDTVGRPSPNCEIVVLDPHDRQVRSNEIGEIAVRGKHVMTTYWNDHESTQSYRSHEGWFKTGDYGFLDHEGYLHLLGRRDDIINTGGVKVSPLELEGTIASIYPGIEVCVVGAPDPGQVLGQVPALCYVSQNGWHLTGRELEEALVQRIERNKMPRIIHRFNKFPKTENGKIIRGEVQKLLRQAMKQDPMRSHTENVLQKETGRPHVASVTGKVR
ncbi:MAG: acyl--CoA ligase [Ignavibacteriales bacterium]|nr:acyl--CoA ligase [Ignavibacteriales bacterium]